MSPIFDQASQKLWSLTSCMNLTEPIAEHDVVRRLLYPRKP